MPPGGETVGCHMIRVLDSAGSTLVEWGRQQQQHGHFLRREDCQVIGERMVMLWEGGWSCYRRVDGHVVGGRMVMS